MSEDATDPPGLGTLPVARLLEELGSARPIPGGGSVAGITNGLAAGLGGMVVAYSLGKPILFVLETDSNHGGLPLEAHYTAPALFGLGESRAVSVEELLSIIEVLCRSPPAL